MEADLNSSHGWLSLVAQSATDLTQDLLSNSHSTAGDLTTLLISNKPGDQTQYLSHGYSDRQPKVLSHRHRANATLRSSRRSPDLLNDSGVEDEIISFLGRQCALDEQSASSPRSGSPLSGSSDEDGALAGPSQIRRSRSKQFRDLTASQNLASWEDGIGGYAAAPSDQKPKHKSFSFSAVARQRIAVALALREAEHFDTHCVIDQVTEPLGESAVTHGQEENLEPTSGDKLMHQAARRLQLFSDHLASYASVQQTATPKALTSAFESAYSQLCQGEDSQEWSDFQAQGPFCFHRASTQQAQQYTLQMNQQIPSFESSQLSSLRLWEHAEGFAPQAPLFEAEQLQNLQLWEHADGFIHRGPEPVQGISPLQQQHQPHHSQMQQQPQQPPSKKQRKRKNEKAPAPRFHCPWKGCHLVSPSPSPTFLLSKF